MNKEKEYMNVSSLIETITEIYKEVRDEYGDGDLKPFIEDTYNDEFISECAENLAWRLNDNMREYLNKSDHSIVGNFCNVDNDYPFHVYGDWKYDKNLVDGMISRLNNGEQSKQANDDRQFLTDWFWEAFGTFGIRYNFSNELADFCYEVEQEEKIGVC